MHDQALAVYPDGPVSPSVYVPAWKAGPLLIPDPGPLKFVGPPDVTSVKTLGGAAESLMLPLFTNLISVRPGGMSLLVTVQVFVSARAIVPEQSPDSDCE